MTSDNPLIAVIVVGCNSREWLSSCLGSVGANDYPNRVVIYVDNGSNDDSAGFVEKAFPSVRVLRAHENLGFAGGNNLGLTEAYRAKAGFVFFLNPDTRCPSGLLRQLAYFLAANGDVGIVGPLQAEYSENPEIATGGLNEWSKHALENGTRSVFRHWLPGEATETETLGPTLDHAYVQGAALMVRAAVVQALGGFDVIYHSYYEEVDLCRRVRWAGYRVTILKAVFVEHAGNGSARGQFSRYRLFHMSRNRLIFLWSEPTVSLASAFSLSVRWFLHDIGQAIVDRPRTKTVIAVGAGNLAFLGLIPDVATRRFEYKRRVTQVRQSFSKS